MKVNRNLYLAPSSAALLMSGILVVQVDLEGRIGLHRMEKVVHC